MLHQLTRHGNVTKLLPQNTGLNFEVMAERKKAVMQICRWAQSKRQFENMVQHMGPNGEKGGFKGNFQGFCDSWRSGLSTAGLMTNCRRCT